MKKSPKYLYPRKSGFYFILNVPLDIRSIVKKPQIRFSLKTSAIREARKKALSSYAKCRTLFFEIRRLKMTELSNEKIIQITKKWMADVKDLNQEALIGLGPYDEDTHDLLLRGSKRIEASLRAGIGKRDFSQVEGQAERLLSAEGIHLDSTNLQYRRLCLELMKITLAMVIEEQKHLKGAIDDVLPRVEFTRPLLPTDKPERMTAESPEQSSAVISKVFDAYALEMEQGKRWRPKTNLENRAMFNCLVEICGDRPISEFNKALARDFKTQLVKYPKNRHKDERYREKSLEDIWRMPEVETISVSTTNNRLIKISGFFHWAVDQGYLASNPFSNLTISTGTRAKDDVLPFEKEELIKIFNTPMYREHSYIHPHQFWLPILGLYTGARIEELCQLKGDDIREVDGIPCLDIHEDGEQRLKTKSSTRLVPVHPFLIELGFVAYCKKRGRWRIFPELHKASGKYSHNASKWFGRYKDNLGFEKRKKSFHSFRHTVASMLRRKRIPAYETQMLLGHETGSITHDRYGRDEPTALLEVVKALDYGVDLTHLNFEEKKHREK
ncbi:MAG: site-specific integrase [Phycisphaerae bacterium]|nr:site-specific integrase [Phycisphaerae bacterium]